MFDWGVLKLTHPESKSFLHWLPPYVHIFETDPSLLNIATIKYSRCNFVPVTQLISMVNLFSQSFDYIFLFIF